MVNTETLQQEYAKGRSAVYLSKKYGISRQAIMQRFERAGVKTRSHSESGLLRRSLQPARVKALTTQYKGLRFTNMSQFAREVKVPYALLRHYMRPALNGKDGVFRAAKYAYKADVFNTITDESAYWLGVLLSRAYTYYPTGRHNTRVGLGWHKAQAAQLEKFRAFLGVTAPVQEVSPDSLRLAWAMRNDHLESLINLGFSPKRRDRFASPALRGNPHFWRGVLDGAGAVYHQGPCHYIRLWSTCSKPSKLLIGLGRFIQTNTKVAPALFIRRAKYLVPILKLLYGHCPKTSYGVLALDNNLNNAQALIQKYGH